MPVRIAIPEPTSSDPEYNGRCLPLYLDALKAAGAEPVVIALSEPQQRVAQLLAGVEGILLPGSLYDVDPQRYGEARESECGESDPRRAAVDELFLQDAFNLRKPVLAICHGLQTLNVWRNGTLIQDLDKYLGNTPARDREKDLKTPVNHQPGRDVVEAHPVDLAPGSRLAKLTVGSEGIQAAIAPQVNSSHHQAIREAGDNLRVVAVSPVDGVIEGVELDVPDHFVLGVQWHPERTYGQSAFSRAIFAEFVDAAKDWQAPAVAASVEDE